jgi:hypothetical protein
VPVVTAAQLYVAAGALMVSAIPAFEWQLVVLGAVIVVETVIVTGVPSVRRLEPPLRATWHPLLVPVVLGVIPWLLYAIAMWDLNRDDRSDADITVGVDHYSVQRAYGVASLALVTFAACGRLVDSSWVSHPTQASFNQPGRHCASSAVSP